MISIVMTLLSYGCPLQVIVHAFVLDERTVAAWQKRAREQCQRVHMALAEAGKVKSQHIQTDEIQARGRKLIVWIALAMDVTPRLWLAGTVSQHRDHTLIDRLLQQARASANSCRVCSSVQMVWPPIQKVVSELSGKKSKKQVGRGRCTLEVWPDLCIATVIKHTKNKRVVDTTPMWPEEPRRKQKSCYCSHEVGRNSIPLVLSA